MYLHQNSLYTVGWLKFNKTVVRLHQSKLTVLLVD